MTSHHNDVDVDAALLDPTAVFDTPEDVAACSDLPVSVRVEILRRWDYDARSLEVAEEENMQSGGIDLLQRIHGALDTLGAGPDPDHAPPTKQGGE